jgi:hypothetical protein
MTHAWYANTITAAAMPEACVLSLIMPPIRKSTVAWSQTIRCGLLTMQNAVTKKRILRPARSINHHVLKSETIVSGDLPKAAHKEEHYHQRAPLSVTYLADSQTAAWTGGQTAQSPLCYVVSDPKPRWSSQDRRDITAGQLLPLDTLTS